MTWQDRFGVIAVVLAGAPLLVGCGGAEVPAMATGTAGRTRQAATAGSVKTSSSDAIADAPNALAPEMPARAASDAGPAAAHETAAAVEPARSKSLTAPLPTADITFDDLKFDIEKGAPFQRSMLTGKIEGLTGRTIRIRGYILPTFQQRLTQFVLVRDNQACCFGPGAALYDCIVVEMKPERSTDYSLYPVTVEGEFDVRQVADPDGKTLAIFHLDGDSVR